MESIPPEVRRAQAIKASEAAKVANAKALEARHAPWGYAAYMVVYRIMSGAKERCTNGKSNDYPDYGGRGIEFRFASRAEAARWVLQNLGPRPDECSIDRIDNARHYEPGNLRWATRSQQARNKRAYRGAVYGRRLAELRAQRPDLTYETIRTWVQRGMTDDEILQRRKHTYDGACV